MRSHNKGCNCKRSGCLKNYCECYESKTQCNKNCKCVGCRNNANRAALDLKALDQQLISSTLGNAAITAASQKKPIANAVNKTEKAILEGKKKEKEVTTTAAVEKQELYTMLTKEVIDATIQCMLTQADECEMCGLLPYQAEKMVIEELGRCLMQIIDDTEQQSDTN